MKFEPGERVIVTGWRTGHRGRRGTVVPKPERFRHGNITAKAVFVTIDNSHPPARVPTTFNDFELEHLCVVDLLAELGR